MACYWPQIHKYYGCCELKRGICVMSTVIILIILMKILNDVEFILQIFSLSRNYTEPQPDDITVIITRTILVSSIAWSMINLIQIFMLMSVIYGTIKKKPLILKVYLYVNIPLWAMEVITRMIYGIAQFLTWAKIFSLLSMLVGGYHLLAINSKYKSLLGKAAIVPHELGLPRSMMPQNTTQHINQDNTLAPHCVTCVCYFNINREVPIDSRTINAVPALPHEPEPLQESEPAEGRSKYVNFKENIVIFDQNQLVEQRSPVVENRAIT